MATIETIDWSKLDDLFKTNSPAQLQDKIDRSMRSNNGLRVLLPGLILLFALDLQAELILRSALDPDLQQRVGTKTALKCVIKGVSKECPGKGGIKWGKDGTDWEQFKKPIEEFRTVLNRVGFSNLRTSISRRGIVRNYLRGIETLIEKMERIIRDNSRQPVNESEYERECYECMKKPCKKFKHNRAFKDF